MRYLYAFNLSRNDLLTLLLCAEDYPVRQEIYCQLTEYFYFKTQRALDDDEDVVDWFLDNHKYSASDNRWSFILL